MSGCNAIPPSHRVWGGRRRSGRPRGWSTMLRSDCVPFTGAAGLWVAYLTDAVWGWLPW